MSRAATAAFVTMAAPSVGQAGRKLSTPRATMVAKERRSTCSPWAKGMFQRAEYATTPADADGAV